MPVVTVEQFQKSLEYSGLMSQDKIQSVLSDLSAEDRPKDAAEFAFLLVAQGELTHYQAEVLRELPPPRLVLGNYVLLDLIGAGGMGRVYRAIHRVMGRIVAVKVLQEKAVKSPEAVHRFHREVQAAARLNHHHIVTAYDAAQAHGMHFLVMEYVEGQDLSLVARDNPLSVRCALDYTLQVAQALEYAHHEGIIHRDVKPANMLLADTGVVKLSDMGIARLREIDDEEVTQLTGSGVLLGTIDFMAPEQAGDTSLADARSDIYGLGCSLYFLLAGAPPFAGKSVFDKILAHRSEPLPLIAATRDDVPPAVDSLVQKMVAKQLDQRCQSMSEVIEAIEQAIAELPGVAGEPTPTAEGTRTRRLALERTHSRRLNAGEGVLADVTVSKPAVGAPPVSDVETATSLETLQSPHDRLAKLIVQRYSQSKFLSQEEEHDVLRIGSELGLSHEQVEPLLNQFCHEHKVTRESVLLEKMKAMLHAATLDDGVIDQVEFQHVVAFAKRRSMDAPRAEERCATLILNNNWPVRQAWIGRPWFDDLCRRHGLKG